MKKICLYFVPAVMLLLSACAGKSEAPAPVKLLPFSEENEKKSLEISGDFANGFTAAVKAGDFRLWQQKLPPHIAAKITPELFRRMSDELTETLGKLESSGYFGTLQNGNLRDNLWKLRFVKDGKSREVLYLVRVFCSDNGEPEISGFGIKRF